MPKLPIHPAADLFPMLEGRAMQTFKADIKEKGQIEPIVIYEGKILDGRNRYRACQALGINPKTRTLKALPNEMSVEEYVVALNLERRHLTTSQRALIAARLRGLEDRRKAGRPKSGDKETCMESCTSPPRRGTAKRVAAKLSVGQDAVVKASGILSGGSPRLIRAVQQGALSVNRAHQLAKSEPDHRLQNVALKEIMAAKKESKGRWKREKSGNAKKAPKLPVQAAEPKAPPIIVPAPVNVRRADLVLIREVAEEMKSAATSLGNHSARVRRWAKRILETLDILQPND